LYTACTRARRTFHLFGVGLHDAPGFQKRVATVLQCKPEVRLTVLRWLATECIDVYRELLN
jgi:hypothetical protein